MPRNASCCKEKTTLCKREKNSPKPFTFNSRIVKISSRKENPLEVNMETKKLGSQPSSQENRNNNNVNDTANTPIGSGATRDSLNPANKDSTSSSWSFFSPSTWWKKEPAKDSNIASSETVKAVEEEAPVENSDGKKSESSYSLTSCLLSPFKTLWSWFVFLITCCDLYGSKKEEGSN